MNIFPEFLALFIEQVPKIFNPKPSC